MPVKITCKVCGKFIKDVEPKFFSDLTGSEICKSCGKRIEGVLVDIKNLKLKANNKLDDLYSEYASETANIERAKRRISHKMNLVMDETVADFEILKKHILEGTPKEKKDGNSTRNVGRKNKNTRNNVKSGNASVPKTKPKV